MTRSTLLLLTALFFFHPARAEDSQPNIIFILSYDVGQGDLGCYGQKRIKTPNLDRLAAEGTRYTQAYAGTSVCAPSRVSLMTGLDMGLSPVRGNREIPAAESPFGAGQLPLPQDTVTVAEILQTAGYATACMGKWGMGQFDTSGSPLKKGFDHFFGYNGQVHAHSYFPTYLHDDEARIEMPENEGGKKGNYAPDLIQKDLLGWVRKNHRKPFFLFSATTLPHGKYEIDDLGEYADRVLHDGSFTGTVYQMQCLCESTRLRFLGEKEALVAEHAVENGEEPNQDRVMNVAVDNLKGAILEARGRDSECEGRASEILGGIFTRIIPLPDLANKYYYDAVTAAFVRQRADAYNQMGEPKSRAGYRDIPAGPMVLNALRRWKLRCPKSELGLVFPAPRGGILQHTNTHYKMRGQDAR